jgi:hypothetical protein
MKWMVERRHENTAIAIVVVAFLVISVALLSAPQHQLRERRPVAPSSVVESDYDSLPRSAK